MQISYGVAWIATALALLVTEIGGLFAKQPFIDEGLIWVVLNHSPTAEFRQNQTLRARSGISENGPLERAG